MLTPYGRDNAFLMLGIGACLILLALTPIGMVAHLALMLAGLLLVAFTLWFFRDPERPLATEAQANPALVVSPADGSVTEILALPHHSDLSQPAIQISIFLSPLDVHVNRYPASGTILHERYFPGKYLMAFHPKASTENERSEFVLATTHGVIVFRQITGFLARRIVFNVGEGAQVNAGERFGMMKFGSRMDVVVPSTAEVRVSVGDKVVSAATVIAHLRGDE
jgi:phosphatidylserine decarboxylase